MGLTIVNFLMIFKLNTEVLSNKLVLVLVEAFFSGLRGYSSFQSSFFHV